MPLTKSFSSSGPPQFKPNDISDPLTRQLLSPRNSETEEERQTREREERQALKKSREIDEWLELERSQKDRDRKRRRISKIMLLGQSQSGKSTTLKNFQLHFAPAAFEAERGRWKTVIHLNLVRSLRKIHEALTSYAEIRGSKQTPGSSRASPIGRHIRNQSSFDFYGGALPSEDEDEEYDLGVSSQHKRAKLTAQHRLLLLRLRPILSLEKQLLRALLPDSQAFSGFNTGYEAPWRDSTAWRSEQPDCFSHTGSPSDPQSPLQAHPTAGSLDEIAIPASFSPHNLASTSPVVEGTQPFSIPAGPACFPRANMDSIRASARSPLGRASTNQFGQSPPSSEIAMKQIGYFPNTHGGSLPRDVSESQGNGVKRISGWDDDPRSSKYKRNVASPTPSGFEDDIPERVLAACAPDILSLWNDGFLRNLLCGPLSMGGLGLKLHEDAGFFLNDVERITLPNYVPTDDDIVRARLKTMGVSEHRFTIEDIVGSAAGIQMNFVSELIVYDVGGARTQRQSWMPFFDDINVIVFLAPISAFDQRLAEDSKINRLQDTFALWKEICRTPTLAKTDFLLFLNKCDLLHDKLKSGLVLKKFIPQYDGGNNLADAVKYFRGIFMQIWRKHTDELKKTIKSKRTIFMHSTSMIDIRASRTVIQNVQECAIRSNLRTAMVI